MRTKFRRDSRITVWEDCWIRTSRGILTVRGVTLAEDKFVVAAAIGDITLVKLFVRHASHKLWALYTASRWDHQEIITYLRAVPHISTVAMIQHAIDCGVAIRNNLSCDMPMQMISEACRFGDLEVLQRCEIRCGNSAFRTAAKYGHTNILKWGALSGRFHRDILESLTCAAEYGQLHVLEWAFKKFHIYDISKYERVIYMKAVNNSQIAILEYLATQIEPTRALTLTDRMNICMRAIDRRQVVLFKWLATSGAIVRKSRLARNLIRRMHQYDNAGVLRCPDHEAMFAVLKSLIT
jgi:hypothetical protein